MTVENLGEKGSDEAAQTEIPKVDYENESRLINENYEARLGRFEAAIKEIFGNEEEFKSVLERAKGKKEHFEKNPKITPFFSRNEELALALLKKKLEIDGEFATAKEKLDARRNAEKTDVIAKI
ncbi:MAG: hypothetical protein NTY04_02670 [Candidatus Staskawiczbacteria bacterium]|nr:hypothetical protein [Candidatus Staskawiczbacteria bacterium]